MARHFINPDLVAANVLEVDLDLAPLAEARAVAARLQPVPRTAGTVTLPTADGDLVLSVVVPEAWDSDMAWWSADDMASFAWFQRLFDALDVARHVAPYLDCAAGARMYAGYFVVRQTSRTEAFHTDWLGGQNQGFTLLSPLTTSAAELGLAYEDVRGQRQSYAYREGKAVIFGDHFYHSTAVGQASLPVVLLCFNFGTDKMEYWQGLAATTGYQSRLLRRPDGVFLRDGQEMAD